MWNLIGNMTRQSSGKSNVSDHSLAVAGRRAGVGAAVNQQVRVRQPSCVTFSCSSIVFAVKQFVEI